MTEAATRRAEWSPHIMPPLSAAGSYGFRWRGAARNWIIGARGVQ
jgi:hypothetical protein